MDKAQLRKDEIDLFELVQGLWSQKALILSMTLVTLLGAVAYAFLAKPVFESEVSVMPPLLGDIEGLNQGRDSESKLRPFAPGDIYAIFKRNLLSDESRNRFFREVYLPALELEGVQGSTESIKSKFKSNFKIQASDRTQPDRYTLTFRDGDPERAAKFIEQYVTRVSSVTLNDVLKNAGNQVEIKEHDLQQKIAAMRETAKIHREDRLAKLREALAIAEAVGLDKPLLITNESAQQLSGIIEGDLMYMRGAKAIRAEINSLDARKSDDPFISGLRALEQRLALFKGIEIEPKRVAVFRLDGPVEVPEVPVKPKKVVVLLIGGFIGALLGGGLACVRLIVRGRPIKGTVSQS